MTARLAVAGVAAALIVATLALALHGGDLEGWRHASRWTARTSATIFAVLFAATALSQAGGPSVAAALANRRGLGLGFAGAHLVHAVCVATLFVMLGERPSTVQLVGGGLAYALLLAMVVTSTDAARHTLGPWWKRLHLAGLWYLWLIFLLSYLGRTTEGSDRVDEGVFGTMLMLGAAILRVSDHRARHRASV